MKTPVVIVVRNDLCDPSSNLNESVCISYSTNVPRKDIHIQLFSVHLWTNSRTNLSL